MSKQGTKYGPKAAFKDFAPQGTSNDALAEMWGKETWFSEFFRDQRGVNGKLKYWHFRWVHFPAIDKYLNKELNAAYKSAKTAAEKTKVADTHPINELLATKPGGDEMVWPFWVISTKEIPDMDIIHACAAIISQHQSPVDYGGSSIDVWDREVSAWTELKAIDPLKILGLRETVEKTISDPDGNDVKYSDNEPTSNGSKFLRDYNNGSIGNPEDFGLCGSPVLELGSLCTACTEDVWEILNYYLINRDGTPDLNEYGEALASLTVQPPQSGTNFDFSTPATLKNYRLNWEHVRTLEETADFLNQNPISVIKSLITKHCGDLVLGDVRGALQEREAALRERQARFDAWRKALAGLGNRGFFIPQSLEDVSDVAKAKAEKARTKREEKFTEELIESVDKLQFDLQQLIEAKKNKAPTIDGGLYGEKPAGSTVMTGKDGFNVRRVTTIDFMQWKTVHDRVEKVIQASVHAANPFSFRGQRPVVVRVGQAKHTHTSGQDRSLHVDDYAGYEIKAEKTEKVADIIEEFNKSLTSHLGPTPTILWGNITLTKEWVDFGNNWPLDELSPGQTYYIPDPRSLPAGDPPASQYPMTTT